MDSRGSIYIHCAECGREIVIHGCFSREYLANVETPFVCQRCLDEIKQFRRGEKYKLRLAFAPSQIVTLITNLSQEEGLWEMEEKAMPVGLSTVPPGTVDGIK
jgi:hypothetical protein